MSKLVFKTLYIFSSSEKKAKVINFCEGTNIITSSSIDGTKKGKSLITKCLYHTMGADCYFEPIWDEKSKIYILSFTINDKLYYMYRCCSLFKLFDADKNVLFKTANRNDLGEKLKPIFNFAVQLPKRDEEKLEITPPAYSYILYYLDQDKIMGTQFASFDGLGQYPDYKENVLYYHFGVFDEKYYEIERQLEQIEEKTKQTIKQQEISDGMYEKVVSSIHEVSYTQSLELLKKDVERTKDEYISIANALSEIRSKLINLRNDRSEILSLISTLQLLDKDNEKQIKSLNNHTCPLCKSELEDTIELRITKYNASEDIILMKNSMQITVSDLERKIDKQEADYQKWLKKLKKYEDSLSRKHGEIDDILRHKGLIEIKDSLIEELHNIKEELVLLDQQQADLKKEERVYTSVKKKINTRYYELMMTDKNKFGLKEINEKSFERITGSFKGGGSNKPIATVIWYINLLRLKHEFNPDAISFPIVFDSPNNAETDKEKKGQLYRYIVENTPGNNQLIVSGIGYENEDTFGVAFENVIQLRNEKYHLLCEDDYTSNIVFLNEMCSK